MRLDSVPGVVLAVCAIACSNGSKKSEHFPLHPTLNAGAAAQAGGLAGPMSGIGGGGAASANSAGMGMPAAGNSASANPPASGTTGGAPADAGVAEPLPDAAPGVDATSPDPPDGAASREDLGEGDGRDVITIGDSWMSNTLLTGNGIEGALSRLTGQPYRNYAVQGVMLLQSSAFGAAIPSQYQSAKRADPEIVTAIMTGGGNDIIQNASVQADCATGGELCRMKLAEITAALNTLWTQMADDGVQDVIFIRYSSDAGSTDESLRGGGAPPEICLSGRIRCHSIDTTDAVMGQLQDGIHPTRAANDRIAEKVRDYMVASGIRR